MTFQHYMYYDSHTQWGPAVVCTCGQHKAHRRGGPLVKWATRHTKKTGHKFKKEGDQR